MNYCKDCKWIEPRPVNTDNFSYCMHNNAKKGINLVTGVQQYLFAQDMRNSGICNQEAKLFEAAE